MLVETYSQYDPNILSPPSSFSRHRRASHPSFAETCSSFSKNAPSFRQAEPLPSLLDQQVAIALKSFQQPEILVTLLAQKTLSSIAPTWKEAVKALQETKQEYLLPRAPVPEIPIENLSLNKSLCLDPEAMQPTFSVISHPPLLSKPAQCEIPAPFSFPVLKNQPAPPPSSPKPFYPLTILTSLGSLFFSLRAPS